jgi:uncharacterized protein (TIGR03790 family)
MPSLSRQTIGNMRIILSLVGFVAFAGTLVPVEMRADGDEVVVVYNRRVPESKSVAEHYADRRQVPTSQVLGFDLATGTVSLALHDTLQKPLFNKLQSLKLWRLGSGTIQDTNGKPVRVKGKVLESKIRYVVLCYGVPVRIEPDATLKEAAEETMRPEFRRNEAAVDSELAALPLFNQNLPIAGPLRNPFYTTTNALSLHPRTACCW